MNYCLQVFCLNLFFLEITQSLKWIIKEWLKVSGKRNVTDALVFQWQMLGLLSPLWRPTSFLAGSDRAFVPESTLTPRTFASCSWRRWSETKLKTRDDWKVTYFLLLQSQSPVSHNSSPQSQPDDNSMFLSDSKIFSFCHGHLNFTYCPILKSFCVCAKTNTIIPIQRDLFVLSWSPSHLVLVNELKDTFMWL